MHGCVGGPTKTEGGSDVYTCACLHRKHETLLKSLVIALGQFCCKTVTLGNMQRSYSYPWQNFFTKSIAKASDASAETMPKITKQVSAATTTEDLYIHRKQNNKSDHSNTTYKQFPAEHRKEWSLAEFCCILSRPSSLLYTTFSINYRLRRTQKPSLDPWFLGSCFRGCRDDGDLSHPPAVPVFAD